MNKLTAFSVAGLVTVFAATSASAAPFHRPIHRPFHPPVVYSHPHNGWNGAAPFVAGAIALGTIAAISSVNRYPAPVYEYAPPYDAHADWCYRQYPNSYDARTNIFIGQDGRQYYCDSPYN